MKSTWHDYGEDLGTMSMLAFLSFFSLLHAVGFVFLGLNDLDVSRFGK